MSPEMLRKFLDVGTASTNIKLVSQGQTATLLAEASTATPATPARILTWGGYGSDSSDERPLIRLARMASTAATARQTQSVLGACADMET